MYVVGMVLLGLGITFLIMGGVALTGGAPVEVLICIGCTAVPMIVGGIALIRRAEDRAKQRGVLPTERPPAAELEPVEIPAILDRVRTFNLSELNWVGWLLLLATFAFVLAAAAVPVWLWPRQWDRRLILTPAGLLILLLAVGFFVGIRWLLERLGVSIYRERERGHAEEPDAGADDGGEAGS